MARSRKNRKTTELLPQADPRAPVDSPAFLAAAQPVLSLLTADLLERADASEPVTAELRRSHEAERAAGRTGEAYEVWRRGRMVQIAAAWLLSCVFVRVLEDRGLLGQSRLAGPGAEDSQRLFHELAPYLGARDYLLTVFRELARVPATAPLFDARHNLVWRLGPSHGGAQAILDLLRAPQPDAPAFRFGQADTRFLGDLYQDLSEDVRERYALLQTPDFVEAFILDRTLEPAIEEYGVDDATVIDPTCGSGHFLLGAFARLLERQRHEHPGRSEVERANRALGNVAGVDINPYAVAIARFRLALAYWEAIGVRRLGAQSARVNLKVVAGDSLFLAGGEQMDFQAMPDQSASVWFGPTFALDDEEAAKAALRGPHAAVVGNPPYITVKDPGMREQYRRLYPHSAAGKYALSAPFLECFFQLARPGGFTGQITSNAFMKREFGTKLVEMVLPRLELTLVVNTAGAYIPGHGTPTVLIFGRNLRPEGEGAEKVLAVLSKRGEPSTPEDPAKGAVWGSIVEHWHEVGYDGEYVSVEMVGREVLNRHPWSLEGGGAGHLKELIEGRASTTLGTVAESIGITSFTLEDEVYIRPRECWARLGVPEERMRPMVIGEVIRDWGVGTTPVALFPYTPDKLKPISPDSPNLDVLWPHRTNLSNSVLFGGKTKIEGGLQWFEYGRLTTTKLLTPLSIAFAFVATHNHFVLDRGGKVFKQTAPIIKLPEDATEDDHLALLAYLNSSTACFWMKQVTYPKATPSGDISTEKGLPENNRYEFSASAIGPLPLASNPNRLSLVARALEDRQGSRDMLTPSAVLPGILTANGDVRTDLHSAEAEDQEHLEAMIALQEDLDWSVYNLFGLLDDATLAERWTAGTALAANERPFADDEPPARLSPADRDLWLRRKRAIAKSKHLSLLEDPVYKRRWWGARGVFGSKVATYEERAVDAARDYLADHLETTLRPNTACLPRRDLSAALAALRPCERALTFIRDASTSTDPIAEVLARESIPYLAAYRYTDPGLEKRSLWEQTWHLQRLEDANHPTPPIPVPPKYDPKDFRDPNFYRLRGKLDVPKERFISYPGCESDEDHEPVYGWAGWDHLQRAHALTDLYYRRKNDEGWSAERLTPILAGLLELLPWLKRWHNEPDADGARMGDEYEAVLDEELRAHGLTRERLQEWRPAAGRGRGRKPAAAKARRTATASSTPDDPADPTGESAQTPKKRRGRPPKASQPASASASASTPAAPPAAPPAAAPKKPGRKPASASAPPAAPDATPLALFADVKPAPRRGRGKR